MTHRFILTALALSFALAGCKEPRLIVNDPNWVAPPDVHVTSTHITIDRHINFELDSDVILAESNELLDNIADTIVHHPEITSLQVIGHTDAAGGTAHNQDLSNRRAAAVVGALQARGVSIALEAIGKGETEPLCQDDTEACHAQNRRVEFLIVGSEG
ncbi:MAG: OmpA family protein [Deltaproteobacteria bacterium]|nr:OmpA family protein [Deltaproteobacteria bacterium]